MPCQLLKERNPPSRNISVPSLIRPRGRGKLKQEVQRNEPRVFSAIDLFYSEAFRTSGIAFAPLGSMTKVEVRNEGVLWLAHIMVRDGTTYVDINLVFLVRVHRDKHNMGSKQELYAQRFLPKERT